MKQAFPAWSVFHHLVSGHSPHTICIPASPNYLPPSTPPTFVLAEPSTREALPNSGLHDEQLINVLGPPSPATFPLSPRGASALPRCFL